LGFLADEGRVGNPRYANLANPSDSDEELKWGHWLGHEGITRRLHRYTVAPGVVLEWINPAPARSCQMQSTHTEFCAVCRAELTRRMAMISGDTFEAGFRPDGTLRPPTPVYTVQRNRILPYAFHGNRTLHTIHIPASVTSIGDFAFIGARGLNTIFNATTNPQQINDTTFAGLDRSVIDLIVPEGTRDAFLAAGWTGFREIRYDNGNNGGNGGDDDYDDCEYGYCDCDDGDDDYYDCDYGYCDCDDGDDDDDCDYDNCNCDIIIDHTIIVPSNRADAYINLSAETITLPAGFNVAGFSINGGRSWRRGALPAGARWNALFNRRLDLVVSNEVTPRGTVRPLASGTQITFEQIQARPRGNSARLRPYYNDNDTWTLMTRPTRAVPEPQPASVRHEFVRGTITGAMPQNPEWATMTDFDVQQRPARGERNIVHFRTAASAEPFTPAGRVFRITPRPFGSETRLRINYNTEMISTRLTQEISIDNGETWTPAPRETLANGRYRATPLDVSAQITAHDTPILVRVAATGTRPSSEIQTITPQPRAQFIQPMPIELPVLPNGRIDPNALRPYNALITAADGTQRWRAVPTFNANNVGELPVRLNPTARLAGGAWTGTAASETGILHTAWGVVGQDTRGRNTMGITMAIITPYGTTPDMFGYAPVQYEPEYEYEENPPQQAEHPEYSDYSYEPHDTYGPYETHNAYEAVEPEEDLEEELEEEPEYALED